MKDTTLTEEQENQLLIQLDEYAMANIGFKEYSSLSDIIEGYKEEFQLQDDYYSYFDFLMDKIDNEFKISCTRIDMNNINLKERLICQK